jgi:adenosine kinase
MLFGGSFKEVIQPDKLHVLSLSVVVNELKETWGGIAGNIAYSSGLLGDAPILFAAVGEDASTYMENLKKLGIDTQWVTLFPESTATYSAITDKDNNTVGGFYPGAMFHAAEMSLHVLGNQFTSNGDNKPLVVISAHHQPAMKLHVQEALDLGWRLFYDPAFQTVDLPLEDLRAGVTATELLIVSDYEMGLLCKRLEISQAEIVAQVPVVVITRGKEGCEVFDNSANSTGVPAVKLEQVKDPTGAGDAFRAGFLYGYTRQWPTLQCAKLGCVVASYAVEHHGTQEHHFTWTEMAQRYQETYGEIVSNTN